MLIRTLAPLLVLAAGCMDLPQSPSPPPPQQPPAYPPIGPGGDNTLPPGFPGCGDDICDLGDQMFCPQDCQLTQECGDGLCWGETCSSCPTDCGTCQPPPPVCNEDYLPATIPIDTMDSTDGLAATADATSCGDGDPAPSQAYEWVAPLPGRYTISATGAFPLVVSVRRDNCAGTELGCDADSTTVPLTAYEHVDIQVRGVGAASGDYELRIDKLADACGDDVCEIGEQCDACVADCGTCPVGPMCGDGVCDAGESCSTDCP